MVGTGWLIEFDTIASMPLNDVALLFVAGFAAGATNAVAGGGTFFTFPALLAIGLSPIVANASNAVAVWPGHAAAIPVYWERLRSLRSGLLLHCCIALVGGLIGARLVLSTGNNLFRTLIPWLTLFATLLFAFGGRIRSPLPPGGVSAELGPIAFMTEFAFAVYGGYFGAGLGVLLMACLAILGHDDIQAANALKNLLATIITSVAGATFIMSGAVAWLPTLCTLIGAVIGGLAGARFAQRISAVWFRRAVIGVGSLLTVHFFWQTYRP